MIMKAVHQQLNKERPKLYMIFKQCRIILGSSSEIQKYWIPHLKKIYHLLIKHFKIGIVARYY